jgi:hypothetical protein
MHAQRCLLYLLLDKAEQKIFGQLEIAPEQLCYLLESSTWPPGRDVFH